MTDPLRGAVAEQSVTGDLLTRRIPAPAEAAATGYEPTTNDMAPVRRIGAFDDDALLGETTPRPGERERAAAAARTTALARAADEEALTTGTARAGPVDGLGDAVAGRTGPDATRTGAEGITGRRGEDDPYAPLGLRLGAFTLTGTLDQGLGWTSNASSSPGGRSSVYSETGLRLRAVSDWSRHSATIEADARLRRSVSGERISEPQGGITGTLRSDLGGDFSALTSLGYRLRPESATSPVVIEDTVSRPLRHTVRGSAALLKDMGKLRLRLQGDVTRAIFADARLMGGGTLSQADRDTTLATVTARVGYAVSPALTPFVEAEAGRRFFDQTLDSAGYERSAARYGVRAGVEVDMGEKLRGEIAAGWLTERPRDDRLVALSAPYASANMAWSPLRGTTVDLRTTTTAEGTTAAGETGSVLYSSEVSLTHQLRDNLTATALIGFDWRDYAGSNGYDQVLRGEARLTWWMNRFLGLTGRATHETQRSNLEGRGYSANGVYLGLTLQR